MKNQQTQPVSHLLVGIFFFRVRPLSDGSNPWSTSLVKSQKSVPLSALFAEQGELKMQPDAACLNFSQRFFSVNLIFDQLLQTFAQQCLLTICRKRFA